MEFGLRIAGVRGSGFSRTVTAVLSNTGGVAATNVVAKVEVYAGDHRVQVNGRDSLRVDVGDVPAGGEESRDVALRFSLTDGLRLQAGGAMFAITITSDQGDALFSAKYSE